MKPFLYAQYINKKGKIIEEKELYVRGSSEEENKAKTKQNMGFKIEDKKVG